MKLSIVIPMYNTEKYIVQAVESILKIDEVEKEIIVINDGSTDNSLKIIENFKNENPNENIVIINQENQGVSIARNKGIEVSTGDYIYFLDSDDWIEEKTFKNFLLEMKKYFYRGENIDIFVGKEKIYNDVTKEEIMDERIPKNLIGEILSGEKYLGNSIKERFWNVRLPIYLIGKHFLIENNIKFPNNRKTNEDEVFCIDLFYNAKKMVVIDEIIGNYRIRNGSLTSNLKIGHVEDIFNNIKEIINKYKNIDNNDMKKMIFFMVKKYYKEALKKSIKCNRKDVFEKIYQHLKEDCKKYLLKTKFKKYENVELYIILLTKDLIFSLREKMKK